MHFNKSTAEMAWIMVFVGHLVKQAGAIMEIHADLDMSEKTTNVVEVPQEGQEVPTKTQIGPTVNQETDQLIEKEVQAKKETIK